MDSNPRGSHFSIEELYEIALNVVDHIPAMLAYWDTQQVCVFANDAYRDWFGKTRKQMIGITMQELLGPLYIKNLPFILGALVDGKTQVFEREIPLPNGEVRQSIATYTPDIANGQVRGMFVHVADVTPIKKLEYELRAAKVRAEELATHDYLTGLPNRVLLTDRITQAALLAKRGNKTVGIITIDMDNFKSINDTYGHAEGDRVLVEIAQRIRKTIRQSDTATRMGGDEFIILAPEVEQPDYLQALVERLFETICQPIHFHDKVFLPTFSMGIALYPRDGKTSKTLLSKSDRALYVAKKNGKNRFAFVDQKTGKHAKNNER